MFESLFKALANAVALQLILSSTHFIIIRNKIQNLLRPSKSKERIGSVNMRFSVLYILIKLASTA